MGRDPSLYKLSDCFFCFNPRARVGRDNLPDRDGYQERCFNPRARVGRDVDQALQILVDSGFNPRARVGRDPQFFCTISGGVMFQSTRPRGARR